MRVLLCVILLLIAGCTPQPTRCQLTICPVGEVSGEVAFKAALEAFWLLQKKDPSMLLPPIVNLHPEYNYPGTASAGMTSDGEGTIVFDRARFEALADGLGPGGPIGIFLHELVHVSDLYRDRLGVSDHELELRADAMAGCGLALAGCHLSGWVSFLAQTHGGSGLSHPGASDRVEAAVRGYDACAQGSWP